MPSTDAVSIILFTNSYNHSTLLQRQAQLGVRIRQQPQSIRAYTDSLLDLEQRWRCTHLVSVTDITQAAQDSALSEWNDQPIYGLVLKSVKINFARSYYLYHANRADTRLFARFRHNRIGHNESMFTMNQGRNNTTPTPNCPTCLKVPESITHLLLHCPLYATQRHILTTYLQSVNLPTTQNVLLAGHLTDTDFCSSANVNASRTTLRKIAGFLRHICEVRQLTII